MIKTLTDEQSNLLLHRVRTDPAYPGPPAIAARDYLLLTMMLDAGLRVGELVALCLSDVFAEGQPLHTLHVRSLITKTKTDRYIPLTERIKWALSNYFQHHPHATPNNDTYFLFPTASNGKHITTRQVQRITKRAGFGAIHTPVNPHMLRHTFATRLMRTTPMPILQALLGHTRLSSTQVYTHPNDQDLKRAIHNIDQYKPDDQQTKPGPGTF